MAVVGITGRKYHGKDTAAAYFRQYGFEQMRFADPLKQMLRAFYLIAGCDPAVIERKIEGDLKETPCEFLMGATPRHAMQSLGTEWGRDCIHPDLWVETLKRRARGSSRAVISDVRFANECRAIRDLGGTTIRIDAFRRVPANEFSLHSSEAQVDMLPVDFVVENNGTIDQLDAALATICGKVDGNAQPLAEE